LLLSSGEGSTSSKVSQQGQVQIVGTRGLPGRTTVTVMGVFILVCMSLRGPSPPAHDGPMIREPSVFRFGCPRPTRNQTLCCATIHALAEPEEYSSVCSQDWWDLWAGGPVRSYAGTLDIEDGCHHRESSTPQPSSPRCIALGGFFGSAISIPRHRSNARCIRTEFSL